MEQWREQFEQALNIVLTNKRDDNKFLLSQKEYDIKIEKVKEAKLILQTPFSKKTQTHYRLVNKYDILTIKGRDRLIRPIKDDTDEDIATNKILYYVTNEELFDILYDTHMQIGHGGRNRMSAELKNKYYNITKEIIMSFIKLCVKCQRKSGAPKKCLVSKPILPANTNSRAQLNLIDMQKQVYSGYQFILVYLDHLTKFTLLKALKSKNATEVASQLLEIFTTFGAPAILHSDKGEREFLNLVISELHKEWKEVRIVPGKPLDSQSQESVGANGNTEAMVKAWMDENQSSDWPRALKYIQFQKNRAFHSGIGKSPYETMFGCPAKLGLASTGLPQNEIANLTSEEDIDTLLNASNNEEDIPETPLTIKAEPTDPDPETFFDKGPLTFID